MLDDVICVLKAIITEDGRVVAASYRLEGEALETWKRLQEA